MTFPLTGTKKGATCDAKLCDNHASSQGRNRDFCPTHAAMKPDFMDRLKARWAGCTACGLATSRTHIVLGTGPVPCPLMFVGEAPGREEDEKGLPFVGQSGRLMAAQAKLAGFDLDTEAFRTNMVACRPPENRVPMFDEIDACRPRLEALFWAVQPRVVVIVGGTALMSLTGKQGITTKRGKWTTIEFSWKGATRQLVALPTLHPAGLLPGRLREPSDLDKFKADLAAAYQRAYQEAG